MFERGKKDDNATGDTDTGSTSAQGFLGSVGAKPAVREKGAAIIGRSIQINGDLRGNEDLRIEGDVSGTVELRNSNLTIGKEGKVRADVFAKSIAVDGTTEGDLYATERVVVHVNARVNGNIIAPRVGIEEGARFKGSIEMDQEAVDKALGKTSRKAAESPVTGKAEDKAPDGKAAPKKVAKESGAGLNSPAGAA